MSFLYILYFLGVHAPLTLNFKPPPRDISVMKRYLPFELSSKILLHPHFNVVEEHPFSNILLPFYTQKCILYKRWNIKTSSSSPVYRLKNQYMMEDCFPLIFCFIFFKENINQLVVGLFYFQLFKKTKKNIFLKESCGAKQLKGFTSFTKF